MPCRHLVHGWRGENGIVYKNPFAKGKEPVTRPCGQCIDCRLNRTREWAIRCMHEASLHEKNCVVTLTYSDENLPADRSIDKNAGPEFMKKLRRRFEYHEEKTGIKTYGVAEYGCNDPTCGRSWCQHNMRPHYHIILFNHEFPDKQLTETNEDGDNYYSSKTLEEIWGLGGCQIMDLNWKTASYVARYVTKKLTGKDRWKFEAKRLEQGKQKHPYGNKLLEQSICISRGGRNGEGIAAQWWIQNADKIHKNDTMYINGQRIKPIKYYDSKYEIKNPNEYEKIKQKRKKEIEKLIAKTNEEIKNGNHTNNFARRERQQAHEQCMEAKLALLKRSL